MIWLISSFAALGGCLYGYDLGLIGGALLDIRDEFNLSTLLEETIVGSAKFGALAATFLGGAMMKLYGRRITIAADSLLFFAGPLMMAFASGPGMLIAGRVVVGMGIGVNAVVVPAYLGEVAPADTRGRIVMVYELSLALGMLAASAADTGLQLVPHNWRWMVGLPCLPGIFIALALVVLPESPRWLVVQGKLDAALAAMHRIYTSTHLPAGQHGSTAEVEAELLELWSNVEKERAEAQSRGAALQSRPRPRKGLLAVEPLDDDSGGTQARGPPGEEPTLPAGQIITPMAPLEASHADVDDVEKQGEKAEPLGDSLDLLRDRPTCGEGSEEREEVPTDQLLSQQGQAESGAADAGDMVPLVSDWEAQSLGDRWAGAGASHDGLADELAAEAAALPSVKIGRLPPLATASEFVVVDLGSGPEEEEACASGEAGKRQSAAGGETERELRDPSSPLHRALSAVPASLPPIRIRAPAGPPPPAPSNLQATPAQALQQAALRMSASETHLLRLSPGSRWTRFWRQVGLFGQTLVQMVRDIYLLGLAGPERRAMTIALGLAFFNQAIASSAIVNYAPEVLHSLGVSSPTTATALTSGVTLAKGMGVWVSILLVDQVGRRPLLVWGSLGCCLGMLVVALGVSMLASWLVLLGMAIYMFAFSCSHAGVFWVVISEIFSMSAKSAAASAATATLFLVGALTNTVFLSMFHTLRWGAFVVFGTLAACSAVFCVSYLPETRGKTLLEVQALLAAPVRPKSERQVHPNGGRTAVDGLPRAMTSSSLLRADGEGPSGIGFQKAGEGVRRPTFLQNFRLWSAYSRF